MQTRIGFLTGMAVGYVFGTRAGRARYEQIKKQADTLWNDPRVQSKVTTATETVRTKAPQVQARLTTAVQDKAPAVRQRISDTASSAASTVSAKTSDAKGRVSDARSKMSSKSHSGNQIGVEGGSDVEPHDVRFESGR